MKIHYSNQAMPKNIKTFALDYINRDAYERLARTFRGNVLYVTYDYWKKEK